MGDGSSAPVTAEPHSRVQAAGQNPTGRARLRQGQEPAPATPTLSPTRTNKCKLTQLNHRKKPSMFFRRVFTDTSIKVTQVTDF